ncbi:hypothetical protein Peur_042962 [Populus x canadensis]
MSHVSSLQALVFGIPQKRVKDERGPCRQHLGKRSRTNSVSMIGDSLHLTSVKLYCQGHDSVVVNIHFTSKKSSDLNLSSFFNTYNNLGKKMGLLPTDQELYSDPRTAPFVSAFTNQQPDLSLTSLQYCQW